MWHSLRTPGSMRLPGEGVMRQQEGCKPIPGETHLKVSSSLPKMMVKTNEEMYGQWQRWPDIRWSWKDLQGNVDFLYISHRGARQDESCHKWWFSIHPTIVNTYGQFNMVKMVQGPRLLLSLGWSAAFSFLDTRTATN